MSLSYLTESDVVLVNQELTGTAGMLAAAPQLRSAVASQWTAAGDTELYPELHQKAAALFHGLCSNHPFVDGNKRTALVAAETLCVLNGGRFVVVDVDAIDLAIGADAGALSVDAVIKAFATMVVLPSSSSPS